MGFGFRLSALTHRNSHPISAHCLTIDKIPCRIARQLNTAVENKHIHRVAVGRQVHLIVLLRFINWWPSQCIHFKTKGRRARAKPKNRWENAAMSNCYFVMCIHIHIPNTNIEYIEADSLCVCALFISSLRLVSLSFERQLEKYFFLCSFRELANGHLCDARKIRF